MTEAWYFQPIADLDAGSDGVFTLTECSVNGQPQAIRRSKRAKSQSYVVAVKPEAGTSLLDQEVLVSYTFRVLVQRNSHMLQFRLGKPTKGYKVELWYGGCGIRRVNVLDFISGADQPRITRPADADAAPMVGMSFDGWVFPKAGVAFCWVLEGEMKTEA